MVPNYMQRPVPLFANKPVTQSNIEQKDVPASVLPVGNRSKSSFVGRAHSTTTIQNSHQQKRWLIFVKPCDEFFQYIHSQLYPVSSKMKQGVLSPLQSTLAGQLAVVAKEFSFPTSTGLSLYMNTSFGQPQVTEEIWPFLWQEPAPVDDFNMPISGSFLLEVDVLVGWLPIWLAAESPANNSELDREAARRRLTLMGSFSRNNVRGLVEETSSRDMHSLPVPSTVLIEQSSDADFDHTKNSVEPLHLQKDTIGCREHHVEFGHALYDCTAPPTSLAADATPTTLLPSQPLRFLDFKFSYPSCINAIYPPLYPHFDIYPKTQAISRPDANAAHSSAVAAEDEWWVESPASPYRLPSMGLASRVQTPEGEESYFASKQAEWLRPHVDSLPADHFTAVLIERATDVPMVPLAVASLPSPNLDLPLPPRYATANEMKGLLQSLGYPSSLYSIYPALYPSFDIYPAVQTCAANTIHNYEVLRTDVHSSQTSENRFGYPSCIHNIYPSLYPKIEIYPAVPLNMQSALCHPQPLAITVVNPQALSSHERDDNELPLTPPSLDRVPSVSFASRLQTPLGEQRFMASQQLINIPPSFSTSIPLVEPATDIPLFSLAETSLSSPTPNCSTGLSLTPPDLKTTSPSEGSNTPAIYHLNEPQTPSLDDLQDFISGAAHSDFSSDSDSETDHKRPILFTFKGQQEQAEALAQFVVETAQDRVGTFTLALAPSIVPALLSGLKSTGLKAQADFSRWEVWWTDQCIVPAESVTNRHNLEMLALLPLEPEQIHNTKLPSSFNVKESQQWAALVAHKYERQIVRRFEELHDRLTDGIPTFDLIIVGADNQGSVGPLIAHHPVLEEHDWLCSAVQAEADDPKALPKVVMTLPVLRSALRTGIYVQGGSEAAEALADALENAPSNDLPLSCINASNECVSIPRFTKDLAYARPRSTIAFFATKQAASVTLFPQSHFCVEEEE